MQGAGGCVGALVALVVVLLVARSLRRAPGLGSARLAVQLGDEGGGGLEEGKFAAEGWRERGPGWREGVGWSVNERPGLKRRSVDAEATLRLFDEL